MMSNTANAYIKSVKSGDIRELMALLSPDVQGSPPTSPNFWHGREMIAMGLSCISEIIQNLQQEQIYEAPNSWHAVVFSGTIDGEVIRFSDHLHVDANQLIDQLEIFIRPTTLGELFYSKLMAEIQKRTSA
ncbi:MAG: hypothetical protein AVDCRST_MAG96-891 [uncultured Segetibacter sp.]|uniref:SnoaL-like domain-containing protein n=1 Tax=uncultured Segetibacter sp. TaxID=481133 RepID=A0A6J4RPX9_9BACT|nr:MAG: hypothetical protein AVDCRST_MAG96-891 [uncultured Segetibacter sp.]